MDRIEFSQVKLEDLSHIYEYTAAFGEGSCQHSPVSMWSLSEKYGDEFCIKDDVLYILRSNLCDDEFRVYLAPLGEGDKKNQFEMILEDARAYEKKVKFISLTESYAKALDASFPGEFDIEEDINLNEYIYTTQRMSTFSGNKLKKRRSEVNTFWNIFGDRAKVKIIDDKDLDDVLQFERLWLVNNCGKKDDLALLREYRMIQKQLKEYDTLNLSGIVLRIDGVVQGFGYGRKLSDTYYDAIVEKGNHDIPHIYKVLRQESVKQCAMDCVYVNMEEDLGIEGLRAVKYAYKPEFLLHKYIASKKG
ncbi:MAG: DUF2156 domain-containing protein [Butyrivibrio sp.]|nr:DUF2156 domain-containing protein [Butyrivibrio sp.]